MPVRFSARGFGIGSKGLKELKELLSCVLESQCCLADGVACNEECQSAEVEPTRRNAASPTVLRATPLRVASGLTSRLVLRSPLAAIVCAQAAERNSICSFGVRVAREPIFPAARGIGSPHPRPQPQGIVELRCAKCQRTMAAMVRP